MNRRTIRSFLADGEPTGIPFADISDWTGKALVAPRSQLEQLSKREEVRRTRVYLLIGPDPDDPARALAYIGEGDNVLKRLLRHNKNEAKDSWERTVVIVSKDENLTTAIASTATSTVDAHWGRRASHGIVNLAPVRAWAYHHGERCVEGHAAEGSPWTTTSTVTRAATLSTITRG